MIAGTQLSPPAIPIENSFSLKSSSSMLVFLSFKSLSYIVPSMLKNLEQISPTAPFALISSNSSPVI